MLKICIIVLLAVLTFGCETTNQTKQSATQSNIKNSDVTLLQAQDALSAWHKTGQLTDILKAHIKFSGLYPERAEDLRVQYGHYYSSLVLKSMGVKFFTTDLDKLYKELHPLVKKTVASPSRAKYIEKTNKDTTPQAKTALLIDFLKVHPDDAFLWYQLSKQHIESNKWMAFSSAAKAVMLNQNSPRFAYEAGNIATDILDQSDCRYEQKKLIRKSGSYYIKAATLKPEEAFYQGDAALAYARIGLLPIAYQRSKKAFDLKKNNWIAYDYARIAFLSKKYDEAEFAGKALVNDMKDYSGHSILAMVEASKGNWQQATQYYNQYTKAFNADIQPRLVDIWLSHIAGSPLPNIYNTQGMSSYDASLVDFINNKHPVDMTLINAAKDICQRTEAHFYTAMKYWMQGDKNKTKHHLALTKKQNITMFTENIWATILLSQL